MTARRAARLILYLWNLADEVVTVVLVVLALRFVGVEPTYALAGEAGAVGLALFAAYAILKRRWFP